MYTCYHLVPKIAQALEIHPRNESSGEAPIRPRLAIGGRTAAPQPLKGQEESALEMGKTMEAASNLSIPDAITDRKSGDASISVADPTMALSHLSWRRKYTVDDFCLESRERQANPDVYT